MGAQRGGYNSGGPVVHDRLLAKYLQSGEQVTSAGAGALLVPMYPPERGKVFITTMRLAVVLDDPRLTPIWATPWNQIDEVRVKKGFMGATAFVTMGDAELGVDSTKSMIGDLERAWHHMRANPPKFEACVPRFLPSVDVRCGSCESQIRPGAVRCRMCMRVVTWPRVLDELSRAQEHPDTLMPSTYSDGSSTQCPAIAAGLSTLVAAAYCLNESAFIDQVGNLVRAIREKRPQTAESFGDLPSLPGAGDQESNVKFWKLACGTPSRLAS